MFLPTTSLLVLFAGTFLSIVGMLLVRRFIPLAKRSDSNEYVGFTFSILSLIYGIYLAFTVVVVWQQHVDAEEKVTQEVVLLNALWRNVEPFPAAESARIHQHLIDYTVDVIQGEYPKMERGLRNTSSAKYDVLWADFYRLSPDPNDPRQAAFYGETITRLNEFAIARRQRILASNAYLPVTMWVLLVAGAAGTIVFTWFYGTRYASMQVAVTMFLSAIIVYGVLLVAMLEYPFGGAVRVTTEPFDELLTVFEERARTP